MVRIFRSRFTEFDPGRPDPDSDEEEIEIEKDGTAIDGCDSTGNNQFPVLDIVVAVLRKSLLVTCSADRDDVASSLNIGRPTDVRHVSHVTFDRFNGFLGLPSELEPEVPRKPPSASASVFGVSAKSMQCSYDTRGNSVPTILLMMQKRLYAEGGLKAEGIFRINPENSQEEVVRRQLNKGVVPRGIDVHCLAGLIKAWFRELPTGVLDLLEPEEVMNCDTEEDCCRLLTLLPAAEAALLDWSVNLMADVVAHQRYSKMNARNVAMVFAPNMTQMADPLTALIHAVQVMNFLKTLILKNLRERDEADPNARLLSSCLVSPRDDPNYNPSDRNMEDFPCFLGKSNDQKFLRKATLWRLEADYAQSFPNSPMVNGDCGRLENRVLNSNEKDEMVNGSERGDWLSLREGVRRFCNSPMFQMSKRVKETRTLDIGNVNTPEREQSWA